MSKIESNVPASSQQSDGQSCELAKKRPEPQRIFLVCGNATMDAIRKSLHAEGVLVPCGEGTDGIESIPRMAGPRPDLVIIELEGSSLDGLEIVGALKLCMPEVPLFVVAEKCSLQSEKRAILYGIDALFETAQELNSLVLNVRAALNHA